MDRRPISWISFRQKVWREKIFCWKLMPERSSSSGSSREQLDICFLIRKKGYEMHTVWVRVDVCGCPLVSFCSRSHTVDKYFPLRLRTPAQVDTFVRTARCSWCNYELTHTRSAFCLAVLLLGRSVKSRRRKKLHSPGNRTSEWQSSLDEDFPHWSVHFGECWKFSR